MSGALKNRGPICPNYNADSSHFQHPSILWQSPPLLSECYTYDLSLSLPLLEHCRLQLIPQLDKRQNYTSQKTMFFLCSVKYFCTVLFPIKSYWKRISDCVPPHGSLVHLWFYIPNKYIGIRIIFISKKTQEKCTIV